MDVWRGQRGVSPESKIYIIDIFRIMLYIYIKYIIVTKCAGVDRREKFRKVIRC